jgi:lactoylglutathione lyase
MRGASQLKVGLRVADLDVSCALYRKLGFRQIPRPDEPRLRFLTFGHTWLILSDRYQHGYHHPERQEAAVAGPLGSGVVLAVPTSDLDATYRLWRAEGLEVTLEPQDATTPASSTAWIPTATSSCSRSIAGPRLPLATSLAARPKCEPGWQHLAARCPLRPSGRAANGDALPFLGVQVADRGPARRGAGKPWTGSALARAQ